MDGTSNDFICITTTDTQWTIFYDYLRPTETGGRGAVLIEEPGPEVEAEILRLKKQLTSLQFELVPVLRNKIQEQEIQMKELVSVVSGLIEKTSVIQKQSSFQISDNSEKPAQEVKHSSDFGFRPHQNVYGHLYLAKYTGQYLSTSKNASSFSAYKVSASSEFREILSTQSIGASKNCSISSSSGEESDICHYGDDSCRT